MTKYLHHHVSCKEIRNKMEISNTVEEWVKDNEINKRKQIDMALYVLR